MFREILLNPDVRDLHRFLMRVHDNRIVDCRMNRLTFGVSCSPYLATQVLHHLAHLYSSSHPVASKAVLADLYVDDFLSGADKVEEADRLRTQLCDLLSQADMVLRKWRTNSAETRARIPDHLLEKDNASLPLTDPSLTPKALGIHWDVGSDTLRVSVPSPLPDSMDVTKRIIASGTAGVFDVLGLFSPAIIPARIILQDTWKRSIPWDKPVPQDLRDQWITWIQDLPSIQDHPKTRRLSTYDRKPIFTALHGFCDASSVAYGAAIYLRTVYDDQSTTVTLIVARARVLPVKPTTIPKAELLGAHLLAKMLAHTQTLLDVPPSDIFAWTDSEIVLYWLPKHSSQLDCFVANRVHAIQDLVPTQCWRHVRSPDNPTDLASRGIRAPDLAASILWWLGPPWLIRPPTSWPSTKRSRPPHSANCLSIRPSFAIPPSQAQFLDQLWKKFSSFNTLVRVIAWTLRILRKPRTGPKKDTSPNILSSDEIHAAKALLFKLAHLQAYPDALNAASNNSALLKSHPLYHSVLSISATGHLLVNSCIRDPNSPSSPRTLIPLSAKHPLTKLLISTLHVTYSHAGISALHAIISHTYLIPNLRNLLKHISRSCPSCQRAYAQPLHHQMGMLPLSRTTPSLPFFFTGVDFAGPFTIRQGHTRKPVFLKTYAAVFVCLSTKAVHIELCASLSTTDFLATFRRFVARRGRPSHVYSDNGTNFVGAREEIRELQKLTESEETRKALLSFAQLHSITWHSIPPRAPHFGGLWEAAVKSMKTLLRKNLQPHALRYEELLTLLTDVEAILNSRPLAPLHADDVKDGSYITAGHFLIGRPLVAPPMENPHTGKISNLKRWNLTNRLTSDLWEKWLTAYLASCSQRSKWTRPGQKPAVDDLVFIRDETLKVRDWPLARIIELFPGDDGKVRAVAFRCHGRTFTRPTNRLIPFLSDDDPTLCPPPPWSMSGTPPRQLPASPVEE